MICAQCKKEFIQSHHLAKCCSTKCIKKRKSEYHQKPEVKKKKKENRKKWLKTEKGKKYSLRSSVSMVKYQKKPEVKKKIKENRKKWVKTGKGKKWLTKYNSNKSVYNKKYRTSEKGKEANRRGVKKALRTNPIYKMSMNVRGRLNQFLNLKRMTKKNKTFDLVGCTPKELKTYLEKQFEPGMTWFNHNLKGWHIDHVIPLNSANTYDEMVPLMHYTNLEPRWSTDNIKKSDDINILKPEKKFKNIIFERSYSSKSEWDELDNDIKKILKKYDPDLEIDLEINVKKNGNYVAILYSASPH